MLVSEILRIKGNALFTTPPDAPVLDAVKVMAQHDIGSLVVMEHGELAGHDHERIVPGRCVGEGRAGERDGSHEGEADDGQRSANVHREPAFLRISMQG